MSWMPCSGRFGQTIPVRLKIKNTVRAMLFRRSILILENKDLPILIPILRATILHQAWILRAIGDGLIGTTVWILKRIPPGIMFSISKMGNGCSTRWMLYQTISTAYCFTLLIRRAVQRFGFLLMMLRSKSLFKFPKLKVKSNGHTYRYLLLT